MPQKAVRITLMIFSGFLCLSFAFLSFAFSFWGTDLTTLQNYPPRNYPKHVYDALIAAENSNFKDTFLQRNACLITKERCGGSLRQVAIKQLSLEENPDRLGQSRNLQIAIALPRANITVSPSQFLDYILDTAYLGKQAYGVKAASHVHFETTPNDLTISQSAKFVALLKSPSRFSRDETAWNKHALQILKSMYDKDFITHSEFTNAQEAL